jgi:hypothetical protein
MGPEGGSVAVESGVTVTFAPGTFADDTVVTLKVYSNSDAPAPPLGSAVVGHAIDLQPEGVIFDPPAVITFPYSELEFGDVEASSLAVWVYVNGAWQLLGGTVDPVNHTVSISVPHFTLYALMTRGDTGGAAPGLPNAGAGNGRAAARDLFALLAMVAGVTGGVTLAAGMGRRAR